MLMMVEEAWFKTPLNIEVTNIMRKTANVIPSSNAENFAFVIDEQLVGEFEDSCHGLVFSRCQIGPDHPGEKGALTWRWR